MAKNIDFMGATFPDVPSIRLPQHEGGLVSFTDVTDTTAVASDVANGKYFYTADGEKTVGTASGGITPSGTIQITQNGTVDVTQYASADVNVSGGGGASNVVMGSFNFDVDTERAEDITLGYSGSGYPIYLMISVKGGYASNSNFLNLIRRYSRAVYCLSKNYGSVAPTWIGEGTADEATYVCMQKTSSSTANSYGFAGSTLIYPYMNESAVKSALGMVRFKNSNTLSVFITATGTTGYGFPAGIEYDYIVVYSS